MSIDPTRHRLRVRRVYWFSAFLYLALTYVASALWLKALCVAASVLCLLLAFACYTPTDLSRK